MFRLFTKISLEKIRTKFTRIRKGFADAVDGTTDFALDVALKHTLQRFDAAGANKRAQQSPSGYNWSPPKLSTLSNRLENKGGDNQALVDTGLMRDSIRVKKRKRGRGQTDIITYIQPGARYRKKNGSIAVSTVAKLQQRGYITAPASRIPGRYVPPRPFSGVDADTERVITGNLAIRLKAKLFGFG